MLGRMNLVNPKKLLHSKWTAVTPVNKEKHFIVTAVLEPAPEGAAPEWIELEAVHSKRAQRLPWRALRDGAQWRCGWT